MKIVFLDAATMGDVSFAPIESLGDLVCYDTSTPQEALERVSDCDVLIVNKVIVDKRLIDSAGNLKLICESATGVNNIDVDYAHSCKECRRILHYDCSPGYIHAYSLACRPCSLF